jgi:hypothetical protein
MTWPTECKMHDLSDVRPGVQVTAILHVLLPPTVNRKVRLYRNIFARLVEKGVREYQMARCAVIDQIAESNRPAKELMNGRIIYMVEFTNHLENCINAIARLLNLLERILSERIDPPIPRFLRKSLEASSGSFRDVRNIIEHMHETIQEDKLQDREAGTISFGPDQASAVIGGYSISFRDIEATLRKLNEVAEHLFQVSQKDTT